MSVYNWSNLSDHDFEMVCRDLLGAELDAPVEAFTKGADGGIDLRHVGPTGEVTLGQAKHYLKSSWSSLQTSIKKEKKKLDKMEVKPQRYLLYTTLGLTPDRKKELVKLLQPYCRGTGDILGVEEIEGLIAQQPNIEKTHYKLWLSSVSVLQAILGSAVSTRSHIRVEELLERARLFVEHDAMPAAQEILQKEKSLIISGQPGIGKTTLAEMFALKFLASGFEVHFVSGVDEIEQEERREAKQLFFYDDFLGRTNLREAPPASEQERLFTMMRHARKVPNKYIIMTTREYLYREARVANERIRANRADVLRCLLDVAGYSQMNRARILYNHLYWNPNLPHDSLKAFVDAKGYRRVIEHANFNPRFIADTINRIAPSGHATTEADSPWT